MKDDSLTTLKEFVGTINDKNRDLMSLNGPIMHYGLFLRQILNADRPDFMLQRDINIPMHIGTGAAITPWRAAACLEDRTRTAAFIRGSIRAVEHALEKFSHRPLHLVEAGCGPLGTLILPLLAHFNSEELVVSLIDLHTESIVCVKSMLDHFNFLPRIRQLVCADATTIVFDSSADIILTETMNVALSEEPQVAITRALMQQHPNALLIPHSIRVDLALLDMRTEFTLFPPQVCDRIVLGNIFELNSTTALEFEEKDGFLPAAEIEIPNQIKAEFIPCLTTTIQVFEDTQISDYDSQISFPVPVQQQDEPQIKLGKPIQFTYQIGNSPGLIWNQVY